MSKQIPIIAVTGSSGAGTSSVKRALEQICRRAAARAAFVEGDSFHRYDAGRCQRASSTVFNSLRIMAVAPQTQWPLTSK
jgi:phosphoribulokinase